MSGGPVPGVVAEVHVWGVDRVLPALGRMATGRRALRDVPGLRFAKLLGTGSARTFTPRDADPHHWALLTVWDGADAADAWAASPLLRSWSASSHEQLRVRMRPLGSRGRWSGVDPFGGAVTSSDDRWTGPVAAVTRARLRPTRALSFWRAVPPVVTDLAGSPGLRLAVGVGEAPVGLQGTFSIWDSAAALVDFAYRRPAHRAAVEQTEPSRWYAEELFARLAVLEVEGTYEGRTP
ncbi:monooxygenase [Nocardioides dongkuii]|uniref:monooxygenase n=1 Tax=Nocardioides dongkuii TaxID=2760089 RepID=UPI0015FBCD6B|nr:monooxygenase [Nocardioides dongkuii]